MLRCGAKIFLLIHENHIHTRLVGCLLKVRILRSTIAMEKCYNSKIVKSLEMQIWKYLRYKCYNVFSVS